eukprot:g3020.t1
MATKENSEEDEAHPLPLELPFCDDFHCHFRDGDVLRHTVPAVTRCFARAIAMPNLRPPVLTTQDALLYRERIMAHVPEGSTFEPLMTLYLTDRTSPEEIVRAKASGKIYACKLYPAGATTNSQSGVTDIKNTIPTLRKMAELGILLLVHGEVTRHSADIFDKEAIFLKEVMEPLVRLVPSLKVVMEHITTSEAVDFVNAAGDNVAATITPQHLLYNRNAIFEKGLRPHMYCLPVLKRERHRQALLGAACSGSRKFFLGTDSAPHARGRKESSCGCAGIYSAHAALELYAEAFAEMKALDKLRAFASEHGCDFYGLKRNTPIVQSLVREDWIVEDELAFGDDVVVPLRAGEQLAFRVKKHE